MKLTEAHKQFLNLYKDKYTVKEFAEMFGCKEQTISNYFHYRCMDYKSRYINKKEIKYIIDNHLKFTVGEIAKNLNRSYNGVSRVYRTHNLSRKGNSPYELSKREQEMYNLICEEGIFSKKKLAEKMCISLTTVCSHRDHIYQKKQVSCIAELIFKHYKG